MKLVRCDAVGPQPWRNGGGLTRELLAWPERDDWALRISVADISAAGRFSDFADVDRWFAVIEGHGVMLALPEGRRCVEADDAPLAFRGEAAPDCALLDGVTRDLNLMIRRGTGHGAMQSVQTGEDFAPRSRFRALFAVEPLMLQRNAADALHMPAMSLAWSDGGAHGVWRIAAEGPVRAFWVHFEPNS